MRFYNRTIVSYRTKIYPFLTPSIKITSGEISAKEVAGESIGKVGTEQINSNEHHRQEAIRPLSPSAHQNNFNHFKSTLQKSETTHRQSQPINTPTKPLYNPSSPHPEGRIWAGRTPRRQPRVPDAPKIKHDKMKQFYMVDMGRKMW